MRLLIATTFVFLFNTVCMPLIGMSHESSHETLDGKVSITWNDDQFSNGLFQVVHDNHMEKVDRSIGVDGVDHHQCHHVSVIGIVTKSSNQSTFREQIFNKIEPLFSIKIFPSLIEDPPRKS